MREPSAVISALTILQSPNLVRTARRTELPRGMTFLLEVAANDAEALKKASQTTGRTEQTLREAAGFYIEQVLLTSKTDSYRVLGAHMNAPTDKLRRHMALLLRWLHPDVAARNETSAGIDRSVFASQITLAWENLKTRERRAAYDQLRPTGSFLRHPNISSKRHMKTLQRTSAQRRIRINKSKPRQRKLRRTIASGISGLERGGLINWFFRFLRGYR